MNTMQTLTEARLELVQAIRNMRAMILAGCNADSQALQERAIDVAIDNVIKAARGEHI